MLRVDAASVLIDVEIILLAYSESNSQEQYLLLLDKCDLLCARLRETSLAQRPKKKRKLIQVNYGAASTRVPGGPNVTTRPRPSTSKDNLPDPEVLEPDEAKGAGATNNPLRPFPPKPFVTNEADADTAKGGVVTPQSVSEATIAPRPKPEEAEADSAEGNLVNSQPLYALKLEPPEDESVQENTATSQALCTRLLTPKWTTAEPIVSGTFGSTETAPVIGIPQPLGSESTSGGNTTALTLTPKSDSSFVPLYLEQTIPEDTKTESASDAIKVNMDFKADRGSAIPMHMTTRQKLKLEIHDCKERYRGRKFIVNCDEFTECVEPDEIDNFFHRFDDTAWLGDRQTMPLIHSFNWPSTTLVLRSSYAPVPQVRPEAKSASTKTRWPLSPRHDRLILPYCYEKHWTLFDVDLRQYVIKHYDSLADNKERLAKLVPLVEERLTYAMAAWNNQDLKWLAEAKVPHLQQNNDDCGIFMVYNANCLALRKDPSEENVNGTELRYRYLVNLRLLELQGRTERQVTEAALGQSLRLKRRRVPDDISDDVDNGQAVKADWVPPSHLGPEKAWFEVRDYLVATVFGEGSEVTPRKREERVGELLHMIEAIGCADVFAAWDRTIAKGRGHMKLNPSLQNVPKAICQLIEQTQARSFKDKVMLRIGKWIFTMKILQDVEMMRREAAVPREDGGKAPADGRGHALFQAIERFLLDAYPELPEAERPTMHNKYRQWWYDSQIWVRMFNLFGPAVLLLIPDGHCAKGRQSISNKQFVRIASREREPFIEALRRLRPDLLRTVGELDQQLEILRDDIAALLERVSIETKQSSEPRDELASVNAGG